MVESQRGDAFVEFERVQKSYDGENLVVKDLNLSVPKGEFLTMLGPSGSGKTTCLMMLAGFETATHGDIRLAGTSINNIPPHKRGIGMVFQNYALFPHMTIAENLAMGAYIRKDKAEIARDTEMVYSYFPILKERRNQSAGTMSGGQQQMLAIGRGLMSRPDLMLLDEPSLGLSPLLVQEIFAIIRRLNVEQGVTILLVEQNARIALGAADYGYVLETGRSVMADSAAKLIESEDIKEFYLGQSEKNTEAPMRWKRKKTWR